MRLIDADALKYKNLAEVNGRLTYVLTPEEINNAPTVAEVFKTGSATGLRLIERPHGKWIEVPVKRDILHPNGIKYVCSACKRDNSYGKPPFCMWCGATMKSEEEEQHESQ